MSSSATSAPRRPSSSGSPRASPSAAVSSTPTPDGSAPSALRSIPRCTRPPCTRRPSRTRSSRPSGAWPPSPARRGPHRHVQGGHLRGRRLGPVPRRAAARLLARRGRAVGDGRAAQVRHRDPPGQPGGVGQRAGQHEHLRLPQPAPADHGRGEGRAGRVVPRAALLPIRRPVGQPVARGRREHEGRRHRPKQRQEHRRPGAVVLWRHGVHRPADAAHCRDDERRGPLPDEHLHVG